MLKQSMRFPTIIIITALLVLILIMPSFVMAQNNNTRILPASETIKGPAFFTGQTVVIDGTVDGSLFAVANEVRINGTVKGSLYVLGQSITVTGNVEGNLHCGAQTMEISGKTSGDALMAAQNITLSKESVIDRAALIGASRVMQAGLVNGQLLACAEKISISGTVNDNVSLNTSSLEISETAVVGGNLKYTSENQAVIAPGSRISGQTEWVESQPVQQKEKSWSDHITGYVIGLLGALLFWLVIALLRPQWWDKSSGRALARPLPALGTGILTLICAPIAAIILMITIIGAPVGITLALAFGLALYVSKIVVAVAAGNWLAGRFNWPVLHKGAWLVLLGLTLEALLTALPVAGFFIKLLIIVFGLGAIILALWEGHKGTPPALDNNIS